MSDSNGGTVWITREEMGQHCPSCAERMTAANVARFALHDEKAWAAYAVRDPAAVCGSLWSQGTETQRRGFAGGTEGRGPGEKAPSAWWDDCVEKIGGQASAAAYVAAHRVRALLKTAVPMRLGSRHVPSDAMVEVLEVSSTRGGPGRYRVRVIEAPDDPGAVGAEGWIDEEFLEKYSAAYQAVDLRSLGGRYRAEQASDGTWTIYDVPIFVSHRVKTTGGKELQINRAWMERAIATANRRHTEDRYLPPLHVHHHGDGRPTEPAGHFQPRYVRAARYEGRTVDVLYADLVTVPDATYRRIRAGSLAYRSAEVLKLAVPEVDSVALLPDRVPFFRLPLLTIGEEMPYRSLGPVAALAAQAAPALAYRALGTEGYVILLDTSGLTPAEEYAMPDDMKPVDPKLQPPPAEPKPEEKAQEDPVEKLKDTIRQVEALCRECYELCQGALGEGEPAAAPEEAPAEAGPVPVQLAAGRPEARYSDREIEALARAKVAEEKAGRAEAVSSKIEKRLALDDALAAAAKDLTSKGFEATVYTAELREIAVADGLPTMRRYLAAVLKHGSPDPAPTIERAATSDASALAYVTYGPVALGKAAKYAEEYDLLASRGLTLDFSRDDHVRMCLEAEGLVKSASKNAGMRGGR